MKLRPRRRGIKRDRAQRNNATAAKKTLLQREACDQKGHVKLRQSNKKSDATETRKIRITINPVAKGTRKVIAPKKGRKCSSRIATPKKGTIGILLIQKKKGRFSGKEERKKKIRHTSYTTPLNGRSYQKVLLEQIEIYLMFHNLLF